VLALNKNIEDAEEKKLNPPVEIDVGFALPFPDTQSTHLVLPPQSECPMSQSLYSEERSDGSHIASFKMQGTPGNFYRGAQRREPHTHEAHDRR